MKNEKFIPAHMCLEDWPLITDIVTNVACKIKKKSNISDSIVPNSCNGDRIVSKYIGSCTSTYSNNSTGTIIVATEMS